MSHKNDKMQKCIDDFSDIDECKGNHSCHVNAICTNTKGLYVCTCHPDILEMDATAQVFDAFLL